VPADNAVSAGEALAETGMNNMDIAMPKLLDLVEAETTGAHLSNH